ncbi:tRNA (adenosine(37)-N6)-threonylcarbamoyltransferase complex dimerization subunit type 1 TsaB [Methyloligella solikamskensis]|uniref:tRNA (Adenosine(37)-N6)-threonylcarbamoyltransferase complex dimerization subunit type 1 TsaB n=1 Tax=Methyloligella solikamskensis TaxID=1177756 RepID=A0ABW3J5E1_9HYPH
MRLLALDTSMSNCSAAVASETGEILAYRQAAMARGHAEALMPMIEAAMTDAGLAFANLDRVAATTGPGSFTGVRIAIAAARGLGLAMGVELWGTDSLSVMAARAVEDGLNDAAPFAIAIDARRDSLYFATFEADGALRAGPTLLHPDEAAASLPEDIRVVLGSGAEALAKAAKPDLVTAAPELQPDAAALAKLAGKASEPITSLKPFYLRPPDAKPQVGKAVERL